MVPIKGFILLTIFVVYISTFEVYSSSDGCPNEGDIKPCVCDSGNKNFRCFSSQDFDLEQIFKALANGKSDRDWNTFEISSPTLTQLNESLFHGMTFRTIKFVHCGKLACLSPSAFYGMERTLENFVGYNTSFSGDDNKPNCNVFESLKRMRALKSIYITESQIKEIPENAFFQHGGEYAMTHIDLSGSMGGKISRIGKNAFASLKNLKYVDISQHKISKVDWYAFHFEDPSAEYLAINLENNKLTSDSFEKDPFALNGRTVTIKLGGNPDIKVLKETVWRNILLNTGKTGRLEQNSIDLRLSPLACNRQNLWLLENKGILQSKLFHLTSAKTGNKFWLHTRAQCDKESDSY